MRTPQPLRIAVREMQSNQELEVAQVLDTSGTFCPVPIIETAKAIKLLPPGALLLVIGTDPGIASDMPAWCRSTKNELVELRREAKLLRCWVRRGTPAAKVG
jgi:tRNA 2-thiouridine synthesizing protein A